MLGRQKQEDWEFKATLWYCLNARICLLTDSKYLLFSWSRKQIWEKRKSNSLPPVQLIFKHWDGLTQLHRSLTDWKQRKGHSSSTNPAQKSSPEARLGTPCSSHKSTVSAAPHTVATPGSGEQAATGPRAQSWNIRCLADKPVFSAEGRDESHEWIRCHLQRAIHKASSFSIP